MFPHVRWFVEVVGEHAAVPVDIPSRDVLKAVGEVIPGDTFKVYTAKTTVDKIGNATHSINTERSCQCHTAVDAFFVLKCTLQLSKEGL